MQAASPDHFCPDALVYAFKRVLVQKGIRSICGKTSRLPGDCMTVVEELVKLHHDLKQNKARGSLSGPDAGTEEAFNASERKLNADQRVARAQMSTDLGWRYLLLRSPPKKSTRPATYMSERDPTTS